jgi:hypothetical protein
VLLVPDGSTLRRHAAQAARAVARPLSRADDGAAAPRGRRRRDSPWGTDAEPEFFSAATHVLAIGAVGMALTGGFFRLAIHRGTGAGGPWAILSVLSVLITVGLGLGFAFAALAKGHGGDAHAAVVAGSLSTGIAAFAVQALFGTPGVRGDEPDEGPA